MSYLSYEDEIGRWMDGAGRFPKMSAEQVSLMAAKIQSLPEGSAKRSRLVNKVVEGNLRFVVFTVKSYLSGGPDGRKWGCPETVDFLQVGTLGLLRAAELYDPSRGYAFATYANYWIRSKIIRYGIKTRGIVHVSESMARNVISYKKNGFLKSRKNGEIIPDEKARPLVREAEAALNCASLNAVDEFGREMLELIPDSLATQVEPDLPASLDAALDAAGVDDIGKRILMLTYGEGRSGKEAAEILGISINTLKCRKEVAVRAARASQEVAALV